MSTQVADARDEHRSELLVERLALPRGSAQAGHCVIGGVPVHLVDRPAAVDRIAEHAASRSGPPLAVVSANLDHVHHFGYHARWRGALDTGRVELFTLLDGMPLVRAANRATGRSWPRLAGSDLIAPILDAVEPRGLRVGFLGGSEENQALLRDSLGRRRPGLAIAGFWAPPRSTIVDPLASRALAAEIRAARTDVLVVGLGKPRQELWIAEHGPATGARALLAFGAVVDFLAGRVPRCPGWMAEAGLEWSYRLAREPRRLARRYLVQGPPAFLQLRHASVGPLATAAPA